MTRKELKSLIKDDKKNYFRNIKSYIFNMVTSSHLYKFMKTIIVSRKKLYYKEKILNKKYYYLLHFLFYERYYNYLATKNNIYLQNTFGRNIKIYHQGIVINGNAIIGDNALFHGNNCVGNDGKDLNNCPVIGNNVEFGYGSTVIGNIKIADNVIIGAHSLVTKDVLEEGSIVVGCPAKVIGNMNNKEK